MYVEIDLGRSDAELPDRIGDFQIRGRLGRGGMGVVLDAISPAGDRVALKLIRPTGGDARVQMLVSRLLREAKILKRLDHPGIVGIMDYGYVDGLVYLAMHHVIGVTLKDIRRRTPLDLDTLVQLGSQLTNTLTHMHEAGVIHRDIKPENVMIDLSGRAVLADFGIARYRGATEITRTGEVVGSIGYIAPETLQGAAPSALSDQYALGRLLFEMAATRKARPLPEGAPILVQFALAMEIEWDRIPREGAWSAMRTVLGRMLDTEPERRFPDARACAQALAEFERVRKSSTLQFMRALADEASKVGPSVNNRAEERVANPTVFNPANTLSAFVEKLKIEPRSPWSEDPQPKDGERSVLFEIRPAAAESGSRGSDSGLIDAGSHSSDSAFAADPPSVAPEAAAADPAAEAAPFFGAPRMLPLADLSGPGVDRHHAARAPASAVPPPAATGAAMSARKLGLQYVLWVVFSGALAGMLGGLALWLLVPQWPVVDNLRPSAPGPKLRYSFEGTAPPTEEELKAAFNLLQSGSTSAREGNLDAAERLWGACIGLSNLPQCHRMLGSLLALTGDPAGDAHLRHFAFESSGSRDGAALKKLLATPRD